MSVEFEIKDADMEKLRDRRGNSFRIDPAAFRDNVRRARTRLRGGAQLFQVIKGDGYGLGIERSVRIGLAADVDGFCVGTPEEAIAALNRAGGKPVILFTSCAADDLVDIAGMAADHSDRLIVTVNNLEALERIGPLDTQPYLLELDCGFGRFGFDERALEAALARGLGPNCLGAYTHFGSRSFDQVDDGLARFDTMVARLRASLGEDIMTMAAASHTMIWRPELPYSAADPGSLLYGLLPDELAPDYAPVVPHVAATLLQVNRVERAQRLAIGYNANADIPAGGRTGVFGLGWRDGLPTDAAGIVLVNGARAPVIGRTLLHSIVDLSNVPGDVDAGDEVVLVGRQRDTVLDMADAASAMGISPTQFHFNIVHAIAHAADGAR